MHFSRLALLGMAAALMTTSAAYANNRLSNPGFENGTTSPWQAWGDVSPSQDGNAHTGQWASRVGPNSGAGLTVDVQAGETYTYSFWGKAIDPSGSSRLQLKFFNAVWSEVGIPQKSDDFTNDFARRAITFTVPPGITRAQLGLWNASSAPLYLDDADFRADTVDTGNNLIGNGGFESGNTAGWQGWSQIEADNNGAYEGQWAARIAPGNGAGTYVDVTPGSVYRYQAAGRVLAGQIATGLQYKFFDAGWNEIESGQSTNGFGTAYSVVDGQFSAPANAARVQLFFWNTGASDMRVDSVRLESDAGDDTGNESQNLISDPGFETGILENWQTWNNTDLVNDGNARSGNWALLAMPNSGAGQFVDLTPGQRAMFSAWGRTSGSGWAGVLVKSFDANWTELSSVRSETGFGNTFSQVSATMTLPANAARIQISVWNSSNGELIVDDVSLTEVDSSSTGDDATLQRVATGLNRPWAVEFLPDGRAIVTEKAGSLRLIDSDGTVSAPMTQGIPAVSSDSQGGLLDIAVSPNFTLDGLVYMTYSEPAGEGLVRTAVVRGELTDSGINNPQVIFRQQPATPGGNHYGSRLAFGPVGELFVALGERNVRNESQKLDNHLGKVVRIWPDGSIPADNPFIGVAGALPEIYSFGHRNPQGAAIHPQTGELWVSEHGPQGGDEINRVFRGANYGWPRITYGVEYGSGNAIGEGTTAADVISPLFHWVPVSMAPAGMDFVTTDNVPALSGKLALAGLASRAIHAMSLQASRITGETKLLVDQNQRIRDLRMGPDGYLYGVTDSGILFRVIAR